MEEFHDLPEETRKTMSVGRCELFVLNIPIGVPQQEMVALIERHGQLDRWLFYGDGSALIQMRSNADAELVAEKLDGHLLKGRELRVRFAVYGVKVKELSEFVSNELLYQAFSSFGAVRRAVHAVDEKGRPSGEGIVEFHSRQDAQRAYRQISDRIFFITEEREKDAHFAAPRGFEAESGRRWKQLYKEENTRRDELEKKLTKAREHFTSQLQQEHRIYLQGDLEQAGLESMDIDPQDNGEEMDWTAERQESATAATFTKESSSAALNRTYTRCSGAEEDLDVPMVTDDNEEAENLAQNQLFQDEAYKSWVNRTDDSTPSSLFLAKSGPIGANLSRQTSLSPHDNQRRPSFGRPIRSPRRPLPVIAGRPLRSSADSSLSSGRKRRAASVEAVIAPKRRSGGSFSGDTSRSGFSLDESNSRALFADAPTIHTPPPPPASTPPHVSTPTPIHTPVNAPRPIHTPPSIRTPSPIHTPVNTPSPIHTPVAVINTPQASPNSRPASPVVLKSAAAVWQAATARTASASKRGGKGVVKRMRNGVPKALLPLPAANADGKLLCPHPRCSRRRHAFRSLRGLRNHMTQAHKDSCSRCWQQFDDATTCAVHKVMKCARQPFCPDNNCGVRCRLGLIAHLLDDHQHQ